jgi:hypothetical protein
MLETIGDTFAARDYAVEFRKQLAGASCRLIELGDRVSGHRRYSGDFGLRGRELGLEACQQLPHVVARFLERVDVT